MPHGTMRILAQVQGQAAIASAYSPAAGTRALIYKITVANTVGGAGDFQICLDDNGTTYDATTALAWNTSCGDGIVVEYEWRLGLPMNSSSGNIAVMSETNDDHTFTIVGEEFQ